MVQVPPQQSPANAGIHVGVLLLVSLLAAVPVIAGAAGAAVRDEFEACTRAGLLLEDAVVGTATSALGLALPVVRVVAEDEATACATARNAVATGDAPTGVFGYEVSE